METTYQNLKQKDVAFTKVLQAIDEAGITLSLLKCYAMQTESGVAPDIAKVARTTHELRNRANEILVGLVETRSKQERS